ncbi:MAG: conserved rane protein of unknown function [Hyphomicrobiales bacterium]|nr:conserved rane protein of unknown function [Hyphomicrobiales bacterium]
MAADMAHEPRINQTSLGDGAVLVLSGDWTAPHARLIEDLAHRALPQARRIVIDLTGIARLDTFGACAISMLRDAAGGAGMKPVLMGMAERNAPIFAALDPATAAEPPRPRASLLDAPESIGRNLTNAGADALALFSMLGRLVASFGRGLRDPSRLRFPSIVHHLDRTGVRAAPIVLLMTFLIGCIIAQQGFFHFRQFGATDYVVDLVTVLTLREIGVLLVIIMVAGRSGSSYAAEIGSMKMREEIDALRTMGLDPVDVLILPRVLALVVAAPLLTLLGMLAALLGAGVVAFLYEDMNPAIFLLRLREAATFSHLEVGLVKAPVMALVVAMTGAIEGLRVSGSAESLGLGATSSVVKSIFLVIVLDGLFAILFAWLGM